jgi:DNA-binding beta-propeller fold protein YncE
VAVVAPRSGRVGARIATREGPRSIEAAPGARAVVAHTTEGVVTLLEDRRVRRVLGGFSEPRYTAVHGRWAYVTDSAQGAIHVIDLPRGRVIGGGEVGDLARHVTVAPDGRTLYVSLGTRAERIAVVDVSDPAAPRVRGELDPPFLAHDVACTPDGRRLWVSSGDRRALAVYAAGAQTPLAVLPAGAPPQHVSFAGARAYVASGDDGTLEVRRSADGRLHRRTRVPVGSYNVQRGAGWVTTPSLELGTLVVADLAGRVVSRTQVAPAAHDACVV